MNDTATSRVTSRYLAYGLMLLYFLTSIAFYLHTYDSAQVKITIVQMVGTVLIGFWYVDLLCDREPFMRSHWPVVLPLLASLASGLLSFSHAAYRGPSLDECLRRVFYIHFALIAVKEINTLERLKRMIFWILVATAVSVIYGMIEHLDYRYFPISAGNGCLDPFVWRQAFGDRIFSTFGNPNFFGNFLVIVSPITLALLLKRNRDKPIQTLLFAVSAIFMSALIWKSKLFLQLLHLESWDVVIFMALMLSYCLWVAIRFSFLGILFFLITLCIVLTESKGAYVGFAAGFVALLVLVLFYFSQFTSEKLKKSVQIAVVATLIVTGFGVGMLSLQRIDSLRFRICTWVSTWEMGLTHPVWGNGIGSFRILYPAYRRPQIFHIEAKHNTETDHAEDEYWEVFQDEGVVGFGIFIWVILTFSLLGIRGLSRFTEGFSLKDLMTGRRKYTEDIRAYYMLGILAAFWGMLIHNYMDVSLRFVSSGIFLWLLAGLIGAMVVHNPMPETDRVWEERHRFDATQERAENDFVLMAGRLVVWAGFAWLAFYVFSTFNDSQGAYPDGAGLQFLGIISGDQLLWLLSWTAMIVVIGMTIWALFKISLSIKRALCFLILAATIYPLYTFWGYFMADVHHNRGIFFSKQQNWQEAINNYSEVVRLNPNYIMAYYFLGNVYTDRWQPGDFDRAMHEYEKVWKIAPNYVQSHHQAGLVYLKKGTDDRRAYDELKASGHVAEAQQALLNAKAEWEQALVFFQKYHDIDPVFEPNYARMAYVHVQLAQLAQMANDPAEVNRQFQLAENAYKESLGAWVCGAPENDVMHEHWSQNHRHFDAETFENLGNTRFMWGHFEAAARAFSMALKYDPQNVRIWKNLALTYGRLGNTVNINRAWQHIAQIAPQDPDVQRFLHLNGNPKIITHP